MIEFIFKFSHSLECCKQQLYFVCNQTTVILVQLKEAVLNSAEDALNLHEQNQYTLKLLHQPFTVIIGLREGRLQSITDLQYGL